MTNWRKCTLGPPREPSAARSEVILKVLHGKLPETELTAAEAEFVEQKVQRLLFRHLKAEARMAGLAVFDQPRRDS